MPSFLTLARNWKDINKYSLAGTGGAKRKWTRRRYMSRILGHYVETRLSLSDRRALATGCLKIRHWDPPLHSRGVIAPLLLLSSSATPLPFPFLPFGKPSYSLSHPRGIMDIKAAGIINTSNWTEDQLVNCVRENGGAVARVRQRAN